MLLEVLSYQLFFVSLIRIPINILHKDEQDEFDQCNPSFDSDGFGLILRYVLSKSYKTDVDNCVSCKTY